MGEEKNFEPAAISLLKSYHWPENVRELENFYLRLGIHTEDSTIRTRDLVEHIEGFRNLRKAADNTSGMFVEDILPYMPLERRNVFLSSVARVQDISNEVLEKHKGRATNRVDFTKHTVDLLRQTQSTIDEINLMIGESPINITFDVKNISEKAPLANIREMEFKCILSNLLVNSIEAIESAARDRGEITVALSKQEDQFLLVVKDNGIGIHKEDLPLIGNYGKTLKKNGNGLGLHSSIHFLRNRGGSFKIESEHGGGTSIFITIPVAQAGYYEVSIPKDGTLVILDDDYVIHETCGAYLEANAFEGDVINFYSVDEIKGWFKYLTAKEQQDCFFIVDGFIESDTPNGPALVSELGVEERSVIYTGKPNLIPNEDLKAHVIPKTRAFEDFLSIV